MFKREQAQPWHPSYWLASLGAGGVSVSFFMYLMWIVPHQGSPLPTWAHWTSAFADGSTDTLLMKPIIALAIAGVLLFAALHIWLLVWNIREYREALSRDCYRKIVDSPAEVQMMAIPLTFAMTVNVGFILGALFVPGLWDVVEWLFPGAIAAFALIGWHALKIYGRYLSKMLINGGYRSEEHNHLSPLMGAFAFAMLSVGFAAPAAMSHIAPVAAVSATLSYFFLVATVLVVLFGFVTGVSAMMQHGLQEQATPSLWMLVPILTLIGIEWVRLEHGLAHLFNGQTDNSETFQVLTLIFMVQWVVMAIGYRVMRLNGYLRQYVQGDKRSPISFGLVCPGVALFVMGMFWWHLGWVQSGLVPQFSLVYWIGIAALAVVQLLTLYALIRLTRNLLQSRELILQPAV